jgi:hypothetical protein
MARRTKSRDSETAQPSPVSGPSDYDPENSPIIPTNGPQFGEPAPTPDPTKFTVKHGSDSQAYKILDGQKGSLQPLPFPIGSEAEPRLTLEDALGKKGSDIDPPAVGGSARVAASRTWDRADQRRRERNRVVREPRPTIRRFAPHAYPTLRDTGSISSRVNRKRSPGW